MIVTGPSPVTFVAPTAAIVVDSITFDMHQQTFTITYRDPQGLSSKVATGNTPAAITAALQTHAQKAIEVASGWAGGSSSVTSPTG